MRYVRGASAPQDWEAFFVAVRGGYRKIYGDPGSGPQFPDAVRPRYIPRPVAAPLAVAPVAITAALPVARARASHAGQRGHRASSSSASSGTDPGGTDSGDPEPPAGHSPLRACEACGTDRREVCRSVQAGRWLCCSCYLRRVAS